MKQQILYISLAESIPKRIGTKKDWPATFSNAVLSDLLRKKMSFYGVIVTDSLSMQGAQKAAKGNDEGAVLQCINGWK